LNHEPKCSILEAVQKDFRLFTESDVQWIWKGDEKVPHPGFTINGASTETALGIEAAWQDLWTRNDKQNNDEGQNKC
jgi:hypothetical protein